MIDFSQTPAKQETLEELETRKANLLSEIQSLGKIKEDLDTVIANHEAQKSNFADLSAEIEGKNFTSSPRLSSDLRKLGRLS